MDMAVQETAVAADDLVLGQIDNRGIATLTLNRPEKFNALSVAMIGALDAALAEMGRDQRVRVIILAGKGKAFCAGHDLAEMRGCASEPKARELFERCSLLMLNMMRLSKPIIARVHGVATAAGCQLVASADLAVATETARFAVSGINVGLFCGTPMVALTRNLPRKQAMEMLLTGEFIDAATAQQYGLVNRVVPAAELDHATEALAAAIAAKSPLAITLGKRLFYEQIETGAGRAYDLATETMTRNLLSTDATSGIAHL
jgi:enoyl-CoA hydratase/carnithine racemase